MKIHVEEEVLGIKEWEATVISNHNVATFIKEFIVEIPEDMDYKAGGYIQISSSTTDGSSKGSSWNSVMGGNLKFGAHGTTHTGNGTPSTSIGNFELDGTAQRILSK